MVNKTAPPKKARRKVADLGKNFEDMSTVQISRRGAATSGGSHLNGAERKEYGTYLSHHKQKAWSFFGRWVRSCYHFIVTDSGPLPPKSKTLSLAESGPGLASGRRRSEEEPPGPGASDLLLAALGATRLSEKRELAERGLETLENDEEGDDELEALLLRQLYLCAMEAEDHEEAYDLALCMVDLGELGDIARQDAARAALGLGRVEDALEHIRVAAKVCPDSRRPFHFGHLGALLRFSGHLDQSVEAFSQATRYGGSDAPLYQAQLALAQAEGGGEVPDLKQLRAALENQRPQKGYSQWILGELCFLLGDFEAAARYLERFLERVEDTPRAKNLSLKGEIAHARMLLKKTTA